MKQHQGWAVFRADGSLAVAHDDMESSAQTRLPGERVAPVIIREVVQNPKPVKRPKAKRHIKSSRPA